MAGAMTMPHRDIVEEAFRLVGVASGQNLPIWLLGGLAIRLHAPTEILQPLQRDFNDIDVVTRKGKDRDVGAFLEELGYVPNRTFNVMNGGRRGMYYDEGNRRRLDVFVGDFEMCHTIPLEERLDVDPVTIPLAELLLTKLQIFGLNEKDQRDIFALLHGHGVGDDDFETINKRRIAKLCANDWGLWRTCKLNVERSRAALSSYGFTSDDRDTVTVRLEEIWRAVEAEPKSRKWAIRDRVGDRKRWYLEPQEVE